MGLLNIIVPKQIHGTTTGASAKVFCKDIISAKELFVFATNRLLDINNWSEISGALSASFQLTDAFGKNILSSKPLPGNLIRIKLPAPGNAAGDGYDWVKIESITQDKDAKNDEEVCAIIVRPVAHPTDDKSAAAHFYTSEATSTFLVLRSGRSLRAMEIGRNEISNTKGSFINRLRNWIVALAAKSGLSKPQWKSLMEGILNIK